MGVNYCCPESNVELEQPFKRNYLKVHAIDSTAGTHMTYEANFACSESSFEVFEGSALDFFN